MKTLITALALATAIVAYQWATPEPACANCVATPCNTSNQCAYGCACAVPIGEGVGYCVNVR